MSWQGSSEADIRAVCACDLIPSISPLDRRSGAALRKLLTVLTSSFHCWMLALTASTVSGFLTVCRMQELWRLAGIAETMVARARKTVDCGKIFIVIDSSDKLGI
jgi:hypothetical protein